MMPSSDIISCFDDSDLMALARNCDPGTVGQLHDILGEEVVSKIEANTVASEALFGRKPQRPPNPDLPEIILLHGITDCHLANVKGGRNRIWLDFVELFKGRFTRDLILQDDGMSDQSGVAIEPDGHVGKKYDRALSAWTAAGFRNRVFCYDWRRSVTSAADHLNGTLRGLSSVKAGEKVVLVAHSMGGLVAAAFAARQGDWEELVHHCIFVGSPLGGSYSVPMTVLGHSPSFKMLDRLSLLECLEDFQRMAASFPGLIDMLPNPELMPDGKDFYTQEGWPGPVKPAQEHLDASLALKSVIWESPIFTRSTHLISRGHATTSSMPWNPEKSERAADVSSNEGDGAALTLSSLAPGMKTYLASGEHGTLVNEPCVYTAVMDIAVGRSPELPVFDPSVAVAEGRSIPASGAVRELVAPVSSAANEIEAVREVRMGEEMALHFTSESVVRARTQVIGEPGFNRAKLRDTRFSWKNALSLAIASLDAYRSDKREMVDRATRDWGFRGYEPFDQGETQGFVCWDDNVVILSFRGTEKKISDWLRNLKVTSRDTGRYGHVHAGFHDGYKVVEPILKRLLTKAGADRKTLWMTGHSLGGALAAIAGAELHGSFPAAGFSTYGQPKLATALLVEFYRSKYGALYSRFKNNNDIVTRIPPGYEHVGKLHWFNRNAELQEESRSRGVAVALSQESLEKSTELSEAAFTAMQARLNAAASPVMRGGLPLPPADYQLEGLSIIPSLGISDHSMGNQYIPAIRRHL